MSRRLFYEEFSTFSNVRPPIEMRGTRHVGQPNVGRRRLNGPLADGNIDGTIANAEGRSGRALDG